MSTLAARRSETPIAVEFAQIEAALARTAPITERFEASQYPIADVRAVCMQWQARMVVEHRSSMVFSQLAQQLFEANAPLDQIVVMMRMAQDELRHTYTCAEVIRALGGEPEVETSFEVQPLARHGAASPQERALRNVLYTTCLSEMVACARFVATLDRTEDAYLRAATRRLLADEVLHGQFGFHYLASVQPWLDEVPARRESIACYLQHAFAVLEEELAPRPPFPALSAAQLVMGGADPREAREVFFGTLTHAVVPGIAQHGIDAERAWRERRRLDV